MFDEARGGADFIEFEIDGFVAFEEDGKDDGAADKLRNDGGQGGAAHAEIERIDKDGGKNNVDDDGEKREIHRDDRIADDAQNIVQPQVHMREDIADEDDLHVLMRRPERIFAGAEKNEDRVEEDEPDDGKPDAHDEVEDDGIGEYSAGAFVSFFAQRDRAQDAGADADERPEGGREVHEGGGDADAGDAVGAQMRDEYAGNNIIDGACGHGGDGRQGKFPNELGNGRRREQQRAFFVGNR